MKKMNTSLLGVSVLSLISANASLADSGNAPFRRDLAAIQECLKGVQHYSSTEDSSFFTGIGNRGNAIFLPETRNGKSGFYIYVGEKAYFTALKPSRENDKSIFYTFSTRLPGDGEYSLVNIMLQVPKGKNGLKSHNEGIAPPIPGAKIYQPELQFDSESAPSTPDDLALKAYAKHLAPMIEKMPTAYKDLQKRRSELNERLKKSTSSVVRNDDIDEFRSLEPALDPKKYESVLKNCDGIPNDPDHLIHSALVKARSVPIQTETAGAAETPTRAQEKR